MDAGSVTANLPKLPSDEKYVEKALAGAGYYHDPTLISCF